jgi:hypothetical protein
MYQSITRPCDTAVCDYCRKATAPASNTQKLSAMGWSWKTPATRETIHICPTCKSNPQKINHFNAFQ